MNDGRQNVYKILRTECEIFDSCLSVKNEFIYFVLHLSQFISFRVIYCESKQRHKRDFLENNMIINDGSFIYKQNSKRNIFLILLQKKYHLFKFIITQQMCTK